MEKRNTPSCSLHHTPDGYPGAVEAPEGNPGMTSSRSQTRPYDAPHAASGAAAQVHSLMRYKAWADAALIQAALALPTAVTARPEAGYVTAIIRHFHTVDCIFKGHLLGVPNGYTSTNPVEPATISELEPRVGAIDEWYVEYTRNLDEHELGRALNVTFTDGEQQVLTRFETLLYVSLHGTGHRGQIALLFKLSGVEPPPDRFTNYLRLHERPLEQG
jgi:uncharacterized damage-inducible protein DinB